MSPQAAEAVWSPVPAHRADPVACPAVPARVFSDCGRALIFARVSASEGATGLCGDLARVVHDFLSGSGLGAAVAVLRQRCISERSCAALSEVLYVVSEQQPCAELARMNALDHVCAFLDVGSSERCPRAARRAGLLRAGAASVIAEVAGCEDVPASLFRSVELHAASLVRLVADPWGDARSAALHAIRAVVLVAGSRRVACRGAFRQAGAVRAVLGAVAALQEEGCDDTLVTAVGAASCLCWRKPPMPFDEAREVLRPLAPLLRSSSAGVRSAASLGVALISEQRTHEQLREMVKLNIPKALVALLTDLAISPVPALSALGSIATGGFLDEVMNAGFCAALAPTVRRVHAPPTDDRANFGVWQVVALALDSGNLAYRRQVFASGLVSAAAADLAQASAGMLRQAVVLRAAVAPRQGGCCAQELRHAADVHSASALCRCIELGDRVLLPCRIAALEALRALVAAAADSMRPWESEVMRLTQVILQFTQPLMNHPDAAFCEQARLLHAATTTLASPVHALACSGALG